MGTVTITGTTYDIYGTLAAADAYLKAQATPSGAAWRALVAGGGLTLDEVKSQRLITMTRYLDDQEWAGSKTVSSQPLEWPRSGVRDCDGSAVDPAVVPYAIERATYEGAALISVDPSFTGQSSTGSNIQSLTAGPVNITFFRATIGTPEATAMPAALMRIVSCLLAQARSSGEVAISSGFCSEEARTSNFADDAQLTLDGPLV